MTLETAVTIVLAALGVMLAILAIGIAVLAIWGYAGFKEFVKEAAKTHVSDAMTIKMKEYPGGTEVASLMRELRDRADVLEGIQNRLVPPPDVVPAAGGAEDQVTPIAAYPGEEERDARVKGEINSENEPPAFKPGADNS
jgi:hypothetical protein